MQADVGLQTFREALQYLQHSHVVKHDSGSKDRCYKGQSSDPNMAKYLENSRRRYL